MMYQFSFLGKLSLVSVLNLPVSTTHLFNDGYLNVPPGMGQICSLQSLK